MSEVARAEWDRLAPTLCEMGLLSPLDLQPFGVYCAAVGVWHDATQASATASPNEAKLLADIARTAARDLVKYGKLFGLSPNARSSVSAVSVRVDKFDGLLGA